jgi:integrin alpha 8
MEDGGGGYQDFAVGAPYDGPDQRGAVYVFLGSREGVVKKPSQVIYASDFLGSANMRTFGWSLSGGMDLDNNQYPDLLVGAYQSGHAVHLRSSPVVHMTASVSFDRVSKQINLDDQQCTLKDGQTVPCIQVSISLRYTGIRVPNKMEFTLDYVLDAKKEKQKRLFLLSKEGESSWSRTIPMLKDRDFRETFKVYLPGSKIHDKLTSLDVQMRYSLAKAVAQAGALNPVLGHGDHLATDSINIQKECGSDNICVPNLSIKTREIDSYLMGSGERLEIQTDILNTGEDAFNAVLEVQLPRGVNYINADTTEPGLNILCSPPTLLNNNTVTCEVGNPLRANRQVCSLI